MASLAQKIGKTIKVARYSANLTQEEVAAPLGIGRAAYSNIENGHSLITVEHLLKLPEILHRPATYFLGIENNLTVDEAEWLELYRLLPTETKALMLNVTKAAMQHTLKQKHEPSHF